MCNQFRNRNVAEERFVCRCRRVNEEVMREERRRRRRNRNNPYSHDYWDDMFDF